MFRKLGLAITLASAVACAPRSAETGTPRPEGVIAIAPPAVPLPSEEASAGIDRFSYIVYGDTRGRRDGIDLQDEHGLVVRSMVGTIARMRTGPDPVRFVLQSGDAVVDGRNVAQWNVSFVGLVNRLTTEGGVPYFLVPGNHDVTASGDIGSLGRQEGLRNYLAAMAQLIPPDGATRRLSGYPTYALGFGNTFVLAIDTNIGDDLDQFVWAKSQLEGLDRDRFTHVVAFFHHPAISSGPHGGARVERPTQNVRDLWMPLFRAQGVDLLFTGHEHLFEHWVERWRGADGKRRRIDQIVTGGGGAPLYRYMGEPDLQAYLDAGAADSLRVAHLVRPGVGPRDQAYHYVIVHVDGARLSYEVVSVGPGAAFRPRDGVRITLGDTTDAPRP